MPLTPGRAIVVLEALFAGIPVTFGDRSYKVMADRKGRPCIAAAVLFDDEGEDGEEVEVEGHLEVDFDLGDFLKECQLLEDEYITELAHRTALVKVTRQPRSKR